MTNVATHVQQLIIRNRRQYLILGGLLIAILALTASGLSVDTTLFRRFTGPANPLVLVTAISLLGVSLLSFLMVRAGFAVHRRGNVRGLFQAALFAALFGAVIILADLTLPGLRAIHPADMNVPFPSSLLFYPVIGFMAEIVFHVLPMALVWMVLLTIFKDLSRGTLIRISILCAALLEPTFQALLNVFGAPLIGAPHGYAWWAVGFDWTHILVINVVQLLLFTRYDFLSMYALRLVYYVIWHIGWGYIRLGTLF